MEIHHRHYGKLGNYGATTTGIIVPAFCATNDGGTIPETVGASNVGASTSSLLGANTFILHSAGCTNELIGYSNPNDCSAALLGPRTGPGGLISLGSGTIGASTVEVLAQNDVNGSHQQHRRALSQNSGNNSCVVAATAVHLEKSTTITTTTITSSSTSSSNINTCSNDNSSSGSSSSSSNCSNGVNSNNCAASTTNEPNFVQQILKFEAEICSSCSEYILDRTLLSVNSRFWHISCLRCSQCSMLLEQFQSCYVKDETFFCKHCYNRQFGTKCSSCHRLIQPTDWVRRARSFVYHLACFACDQCKRQLSTGEEFALQDCRLLCKQHYMELVEGESGQQKTKAKRVRTTFAEEQLAVLQTHFQIDSNPDGADLERIATMTGLSKRVTQVWFQNSRARQKKYQGSKKNRINNNSGRSSTDPCSSPKSPSGDSTDGMIFPTSVLTSAEDAMVVPKQQTLLSTAT